MAEEGFGLKKAMFGSIRKKFAIWIGITTILLLIVVILSNMYMTSINTIQDEIESDIVPGTVAMLEMSANTEKLKGWTLGYILRGNVERNNKTVKERINETGLSLIDASAVHLEHERHLGPKEQNEAEELDTKVIQIIAASNKIVEMKDNGMEIEQLLEEMGKKYKPIYLPLIEQLGQHLSIHKTEFKDAENTLDRQIAETSTFTTSIILFALVLSIVIGIFISRSIVRPVKKLRRATEDVEKGNFKTRVSIKTGDEMEQLGNSFNKTAEALERMDKEHKQLEHAKTEFLSITSHELRSPMTPMKAQLQMLEAGYFGKLNPKQKEALDIVLRNTSRLDNIVVDFLEISRIEAARLKFRFKKTSLNDYIRRLVEEMNGFMPEKKIEIIARIPNLPLMEVDPDRAMQVLRNLVNNAKKFSPEKSKIVISAHPENKAIFFSVKDQGIGIKPEDRRRIFEPFFQEEQTMYRKFGGTGLGLTICKGIIESQGGKIWIGSEKEKGTTVYFTVPLKPVKKIKPIKLLFSPQENIEKKIKLLFSEILGPLGEKEFEEYKNKHRCTKGKLLEYVALLGKQGIITAETGREFRRKIGIICGEEKGRGKEIKRKERIGNRKA